MPADSRELVERIASSARQQTATSEIDSIKRQLTASRKRITPAVITEFEDARAKLVDSDPNFRRAYVALLVDQVVLSADQIRLTGTRSAFEHLFVSDKPPLAGKVPIFDRGWCPMHHPIGHSERWEIFVEHW